MPSTPTYEIEFPLTGPVFEHAMAAMVRIEAHMGDDGCRLEPLVRSNGRLVDPWWALEAPPTAYAYRIHLDPLATPAVEEVWRAVLAPLAAQGVAVRTVKMAA